MTTGIYALYWEEQDLVYVGLSQDITHRFVEHINSLKRDKHTNYKVQDTFNRYGVPVLVILELCEINKLNEQEILWTKEFNSINTGLNIIEAGYSGFGVNSRNSKYTRLQILQVFRLLYTTTKSYKEISYSTKVAYQTISDIQHSISHIWLKEEYPFQYLLMKNTLVGQDRKKGIKVISPEGLIHTVYNISKFSREYKLDDSNFSKVIRGVQNYNSHKGWRLYIA